MTIEAVPAINLPNLYMSGLQLSVTSNTTLTVQAGQSRDSTNVFDMDLGNYLGVNPNFSANSPTVLTSTVNGINGLDTGTVAVSTVYAVYVISDPVHFNPPGLLMSLSYTQPTMPFGYSVFRRIGWAVTDSSAHFITIYQTGSGNVRNYSYGSGILIASVSGTGSFAPLLLGATIPSILTEMYLNVRLTNGTAGDLGLVKISGSAATNFQPQIIVECQVTGLAITAYAQKISQQGTPPAVDVVSPSGSNLSVYMSGWVDYL